jgi:hypothetical protein
MAQDIRTFYTSSWTKDFARQNQFRIKTWQANGVTLVENELVYMESASLPGRAITNQQVPFMGLQFNVPGTATYPGSEGWTVQFRCPQNYDLRSKLESATFLTFDDSTSTGDYNTGRPASTLTLALLDKKLSSVREYTLYGVYVQNVGEVAYNVGDAGSIVTFPATVAYHYWRVTKGSTLGATQG